MASNWERAVDHFLYYFPPSIDKWILCFQVPEQTKIAQSLLARFKSVQPFVLGRASIDEVRRTGEQYLADSGVGYVEIAVNNGTPEYSGIDYRQALMPFAHWPNARVRLCLDVWDGNFAVLFSEPPQELADRCRQMQAALKSARILTYEPQTDPSRGKQAFQVDCEGTRWVAYTGFEDCDYILPPGEVAGVPRSVQGELDVDGWIIGSIPFGLKYGRIRRGELLIRFEEGQVHGISGSNVTLCSDVEAALERLPAIRTVSEFGVGQSRAVVSAASDCATGHQWHERYFGVHLGLGAELAETSAGPPITSHHLDIVLAGGLLSSQSDIILKW